ncbi:hypothetical protein SMF913_12568 [Streptomyces malaysiensis]|uniref:Uncharacterized protein n=1 Tax=Streptomyces malaysiensis TaxID=92644 RepID=A0A2J7Z8E3_STRMQ|nr:hypothetical protein SMF913_12568 [Streptomyces malaysiensis]
MGVEDAFLTDPPGEQAAAPSPAAPASAAQHSTVRREAGWLDMYGSWGCGGSLTIPAQILPFAAASL